MLRSIIPCFCLAMMMVQGARAADTNETAVEAFQALCMGDEFEFDALDRAAGKMKAKLNEDIRPPTPAGTSLHVKRWETTVAGEDVVLMVTDAAQPNKHLVICTISMGGPKGSNPRELLVKKLALGTPVKDEPPGKDGKRSIAWDKDVRGTTARIEISLKDLTAFTVMTVSRVQSFPLTQ
jgi:hypothetical protein